MTQLTVTGTRPDKGPEKWSNFELLRIRYPKTFDRGRRNRASYPFDQYETQSR